MFDNIVTKESKNAAWESIGFTLKRSFPESRNRSVEELKKK